MQQLADEQKKILFQIKKRQDEHGRESSTMLMSAFKEQIDTYAPLLDSGLLTYERFGSGKDAMASLIVQPEGLAYCIKHHEELEQLLQG